MKLGYEEEGGGGHAKGKKLTCMWPGGDVCRRSVSLDGLQRARGEGEAAVASLACGERFGVARGVSQALLRFLGRSLVCGEGLEVDGFSSLLLVVENGGNATHKGRMGVWGVSAGRGGCQGSKWMAGGGEKVMGGRAQAAGGSGWW